uniref:Uncharacterized protein n=1 Tax=Amphimedon queenslandica TaxID=400682 RepID=A0A1X7UQY8_AMPQE
MELKRRNVNFVDYHERSDVAEYRQKLCGMVGLGFLISDKAATEDARNALRHGIAPICQERVEKTVIMFYDEITLQNQCTVWAEKGTSVFQPKSKGSGIMLRDFIAERNGYFCLTEEEYEKAK